MGWYHSHTRSEIFLSDADLEIHRRFFPEPWQVALVMKPHTFQPTRIGFFFREADGSVQAERSYREDSWTRCPSGRCPWGCPPRRPRTTSRRAASARTRFPLPVIEAALEPEPAPVRYLCRTCACTCFSNAGGSHPSARTRPAAELPAPKFLIESPAVQPAMDGGGDWHRGRSWAFWALLFRSGEMWLPRVLVRVSGRRPPLRSCPVAPARARAQHASIAKDSCRSVGIATPRSCSEPPTRYSKSTRVDRC